VDGPALSRSNVHGLGRPETSTPFPASPLRTVHAVLPYTARPQAVDARHSALPRALAAPPSSRPSEARSLRVTSLAAIPLPPRWAAHLARDPSLHQGSVVPGISGTTASSDPRSALTHFAGTPLIGLAAPSPQTGWHPAWLTAGAKTGLSCSVMGCVIVPLPIRRRVLGCCTSKPFAPSMAFASKPQARLPLVPGIPQGEITTRQDSSSYGLITCSTPEGPLSWRFDVRISPSASHQLQGCLATTLAGLTPASPSQLRRTHGEVSPTHALRR
jgi:hypothetical protein